MVQFDSEYKGGLRCEAIHAPSGAVLITDAPKDNNGQGRSFSPTDLVATALGTCIMTTMAIWAERSGVNLTGATFSTTKEMTTTAPRKIAKLTVKFQMPAGVSDEHRVRCEATAKACPVHHALHGNVELDVSFVWG